MAATARSTNGERADKQILVAHMLAYNTHYVVVPPPLGATGSLDRRRSTRFSDYYYRSDVINSVLRISI